MMAELHTKHPGDRENSLYASVELSLRRLPPELREQVKALGVFHGGANLVVLRMMLEADEETVNNIARQLIEVGLGEAMDYGHLRLDPALPSYLLGQMDAAEREVLQSRWAEAMQELTAFLYEQFFQDTQLAAQLTLLELPNLLALLAWAEGALTPEEMVDLAEWWKHCLPDWAVHSGSRKRPKSERPLQRLWESGAMLNFRTRL